ncbi:unnamed protein product [Schistosoma intercalatum]|nr:unnamed protein product [Schistosoma intercalatum]
MFPVIHLSVKDELDKMVIEMMKGGYISIKKADQILDIFRARYPELPTSVRSVLRRCNDVEPKILDSGTATANPFQRIAVAVKLRWSKLRSLETALENEKFRDHFMGRLYHLLCDDFRKSAKACRKYLLSPELANTYTLHGTKSKFGISKYKFYSTVQSALCSHFRSASCPKKEIIHAMATASQAFLHDARDKVHKRGWRSKERLASQALSDVTNIINDSSTST